MAESHLKDHAIFWARPKLYSPTGEKLYGEWQPYIHLDGKYYPLNHVTRQPSVALHSLDSKNFNK